MLVYHTPLPHDWPSHLLYVATLCLAGKMALVELTTLDQAKAVLAQGLLHDPLPVFVARPAALTAAHAEGRIPEAAASAQLAAAAAATDAARSSGVFQVRTMRHNSRSHSTCHPTSPAVGKL